MARNPPSFNEAVRTWARIASLSFGGPAGQIAVMHRILVEEKRWIGETRFLHALNYCMLLPGPEAHQLAIYIGWLMHGLRGGLVAGALFVLPGFLAILVLSYVYVLIGQAPLIEGLFFGLKAAVLAIVLQAVVRIGSRALKSRALAAIAAAAFVALFVFAIPFPLVIAAAGLIGFAGGRTGVAAFLPAGKHAKFTRTVDDADTVLGEALPAHARASAKGSLRIAAILLLLWLAPIGVLFVGLGPDHVFTRIGAFFAQMAVVTFGGAYAVLAYVAQQAVETYGWVRPEEMLDGLGMAETTPGPLIQVVQFVGFMGAYRSPGGLGPLLAATLASVLTTWVTFLPSFLWIFLGAPYIEALRGNRALSAALRAITAAVVGVVLNLAVWFSLHLLFGELRPLRGVAFDLPVLRTVDLAALALTIACLLAVFRFKAGAAAVLALSAAAGAALHLFSLVW